MNIKMIVTDLDGTLLRRDKTVSEYTASVFYRCRKAGIKTIFATARPVRAVEKWLNIGIQNDACIYHNGAVIKIGDELFQETGIEHDVVNKLLEEAKQLSNMRIVAEINDMLYANFDASTVWPGVEYIMTDFCELPKLPADKIIFITADKTEINKIEQLFNENLYWEISENEVLMVMNKNARKRNAVKDIANHFGFALNEVAAFGDDYNDIEMLRDCGIGIAVANAINEVKAAADYVCATNDNDGVAKWLEENVL
jgi:Cof subfamily protein (haloacid dehalogenase superfamily)